MVGAATVGVHETTLTGLVYLATAMVVFSIFGTRTSAFFRPSVLRVSDFPPGGLARFLQTLIGNCSCNQTYVILPPPALT